MATPVNEELKPEQDLIQTSKPLYIRIGCGVVANHISQVFNGIFLRVVPQHRVVIEEAHRLMQGVGMVSQGI